VNDMESKDCAMPDDMLLLQDPLIGVMPRQDFCQVLKVPDPLLQGYNWKSAKHLILPLLRKVCPSTISNRPNKRLLWGYHRWFGVSGG